MSMLVSLVPEGLRRSARRFVRQLILLLLRVLPASLRQRLLLRPFRAAQARLLTSQRAPGATQERVLAEILHLNRDTEFGRSHAFAEIKTLAQFRNRVPVRGYAELAPYTTRHQAGEQDVLVSGALCGFVTDEVHGPGQLVPVSPTALRQAEWLEDLVQRETIRHCPETRSGVWLEVIPLHRPPAAGQQLPVVPTATILKHGSADRLRTAVVPPIVFTVAEEQARYYLMLRLAMAQPVTVLRATCPGTLTILAQHLERQADRLLEDLARGRVAHLDELPSAVRDTLSMQVPLPTRAERLAKLAEQHGRLQVRDVWPELRAVVCNTSGTGGEAADHLQDHLGTLTLIDQGWRRCTATLTLPQLHGDVGPAALLAQVLELQPAEAAGGADETLPVESARGGRRYTPVVTGYNGLYRLRLDVEVEVVDAGDGILRLAVVGQRAQQVPLGGGTVSEAQVCHALTEASRSINAVLAGHTGWFQLCDKSAKPADTANEGANSQRGGFWSRLLARSTPAEPRGDNSSLVTTLRWAVETEAEIDATAARKLLQVADNELRQTCPAYRQGRDALELGTPQLIVLGKGAFARRRHDRLASGAPDGHDPLPFLRRCPLILAETEIELLV